MVEVTAQGNGVNTGTSWKENFNCMDETSAPCPLWTVKKSSPVLFISPGAASKSPLQRINVL